jgi:NAD-dependent deacetylase
MTHDVIDPHDVDAVAGALARARSALFITGAGISADSGLPTYRGIGGLYDRDVTEEGVPIEVALSGDMLRSNPALCWKYIAQIEAACRGARPNRAHELIAEWERRIDRTWVLTQNVDGFHRAAGSKNLIEIHGRIHELLCTRCGSRRDVDDYGGLSIPPACVQCSALVRPAVVLFGEMLPAAALKTLQRELMIGFDVVLSIGTTSVFPYIAEPVLLARRARRMTVEINPGEREVSERVDVRLRARATDALARIWARYTGSEDSPRPR